MPRFVAIPVGQGDAFLLDHGSRSVLVDGGRSRTAFAGMFQAVTQRSNVNVAVCTHNDADHSNGILGFLEAGLRCEELWLPGRWLGTLPNLLKPFVEVFVTLADEVAHAEIPQTVPEFAQTGEPLPALEQYALHLPDRADDDGSLQDAVFVGEDGWPPEYLESLEDAEPWDERQGPWPPWPLDEWPDRFFHPRFWELGRRRVQLLWSAIDAAHRIRAIAIEAFHRGIPVRWFEFDTMNPGGGISSLYPLNARLLARVRPMVEPLLYRLALTAANRESLVFWSPGTSACPGVLFTADSDLRDINLPGSGLAGAIVTAPHHGSEANADAYAAVHAALPQQGRSPTWVRSDGRYRARPGRTYRQIVARRFCTLCRHSPATPTSKQAVILYSRNGAWTRHQSTALCTCL